MHVEDAYKFPFRMMGKNPDINKPTDNLTQISKVMGLRLPNGIGATEPGRFSYPYHYAVKRTRGTIFTHKTSRASIGTLPTLVKVGGL